MTFSQQARDACLWFASAEKRVKVGAGGRRGRSPAARQRAPVQSASEISADGVSCSHWGVSVFHGSQQEGKPQKLSNIHTSFPSVCSPS